MRQILSQSSEHIVFCEKSSKKKLTLSAARYRPRAMTSDELVQVAANLLWMVAERYSLAVRYLNVQALSQRLWCVCKADSQPTVSQALRWVVAGVVAEMGVVVDTVDSLP